MRAWDEGPLCLAALLLLGLQPHGAASPHSRETQE
jgi:hypothetical protein